MHTILTQLYDAKEYGSILTITPQDWDALYARFPQIRHIRCTVSKLAPPLGGKLEKVSVVLEK
jgi:dihydroneopterin aldolase